MNNWTNQKIKYREYHKEYVDIETGEVITEQEFKNNYGLISTQYRKEYGKEKCITTRTNIGINKKQGDLFNT